jgi:hypothetical protein
MSTQADYTAEEWNLVTSGPVVAGTTIVVADPAFFGAIKESAAIAQAIVASGQTSQVELIQAIAAAGKGGQKYQTPDVPKDQGTEGAMKMLIAECRRAVKLVKEKSPDEAKDYAQYLVYIAQVTAESSKEGGFLGIGATRVSEQETAAIDRLAEALGVSSEQS